MPYYVFRKPVAFGLFEYIEDFAYLTTTRNPARACQVPGESLCEIDLGYLQDYGFTPVDASMIGVHLLDRLLFRPPFRGYRPPHPPHFGRFAPRPPRGPIGGMPMQRGRGPAQGGGFGMGPRGRGPAQGGFGGMDGGRRPPKPGGRRGR